MTFSIQEVVDSILSKKKSGIYPGSFLVGVSGIDGCGKGYITSKLVHQLLTSGHNVAGINIDGWLNLPSIRFHKSNPAQHFYDHAIRFEEMFAQLILPLKQNRSIDITTDFTEETAQEYRKHHYRFTDVDIVIVEGIYLFKNVFREYFDFKIWIECSFETALE